jgi:upstream activation factor subunit UAF30
MPKKSSKTETEQVAAPASVAPTMSASSKKQSASKTETVVPVSVSVSAVPVPVPTEASSAAAPETDAEADVDGCAEQLVKQSAAFHAKLQQLSVMISNIKTEFRVLEKKYNREVKVAQKVSSKRKRKAGNRAPSGFVKPTKISDELASFLGKTKDSMMARTEVTRDINKYIRTNNLQDKKNGRKIIPDAKLASLLKISNEEELTYFNLQRYMSPHFAKASKDVVVINA